jgi:ribosome-binding factor A
VANHKIERIESDIKKYIPIIIQRESTDELLKSITITGCKLAHDLSFCKVYFTSLSDLDHKALEKEVNEASSFIRGFLSQKMEIRNTPVLKFEYDESIEYAARIENIIEQIHNKED